MIKAYKKSVIISMALIVLLGTVLAGCGTKSAKAGEQKFRMNIASEAPTLDPAEAQDNSSFTVMKGLFDGLTYLDDKGAVQPAAAEKWEISSDLLTYTFHLRSGMKWSNGDPVKASDFEYSWKRTLDPALNPPSPYAYQLYYLKNAEEYNSKKAAATDVGVKATDDSTLIITLKSATPYFLSLTSFFTFYPVDQKVVSANPKWASEAASFVSNGAFTLKEWQHNDHILLSKSDSYYAKKDVSFTEVRFAMVSDSATELNMYNSNQLERAGRPVGQIPTDQIKSLQQSKKDELTIRGSASTYYYEFNNNAAPFDNVNIRKAFAMSINRQDIVDKVTLSNQIPAFGFVPPGITGEKKDYRDEVKGDYFKEDVTEAKKLLAQGMKEKGYDKLPEITLIYNKGDAHKKIATAIADMWSKNLGVTVKIEVQEWKVFLKNRTSKNYQIARAGWGADYNDPMTFTDLWTSTSGNNDTGFKNADYDNLVKEAYSTGDNHKRNVAMANAEKIAMDNMIIMPIYYYTEVFLQKPSVKNVITDYAGNIDYTRGYISK